MKILHTSDLHIGQEFYGQSRYDEFNKLKNWFLHTIEKEKIDVFLISGDIFDVHFPSNKALSFYYDFLNDLRNKTKVIITGGNHDSPHTLNSAKSLLNALGIEIISGGIDNTHKIIEFDDFILVAVPFLRESIVYSFEGESFYEKLKNFYQNLLKEAKKLNNKKIITTGHFTVYEVNREANERIEYNIGNIDSIPSDVFDGYDYVALGHIHKHSKIKEKENIYYSGSPLKLSFSEPDEKKIIIVNIENNKLKIDAKEIPSFRKFIRIKANEKNKKNILEKLSNNKDEIKPFVDIEVKNIDEYNEIKNIIEPEKYVITRIAIKTNEQNEQQLQINESEGFENIINKILESHLSDYDNDKENLINKFNEIKQEALQGESNDN